MTAETSPMSDADLPRNAVGKIDKKELRRQHVH